MRWIARLFIVVVCIAVVAFLVMGIQPPDSYQQLDPQRLSLGDTQHWWQPGPDTSDEGADPSEEGTP